MSRNGSLRRKLLATTRINPAPAEPTGKLSKLLFAVGQEFVQRRIEQPGLYMGQGGGDVYTAHYRIKPSLMALCERACDDPVVLRFERNLATLTGACLDGRRAWFEAPLR